MSEAPTVLAKGNLTTATGTPAPVQVKAKATVLVKFRLFPAADTAELDPSLAGNGPSSNLSGLALILGTVEGGTFKPFEDRIRTAPVSVSNWGQLSGGCFKPLTAAEIAECKKAAAKRKDKSLSADEKKAAMLMRRANFASTPCGKSRSAITTSSLTCSKPTASER
jgi:hypothetical protein